MTDLVELRTKLKKYTVLFVDDEESIRFSTGRFLKKFFNSVDVADNGETGLQSYKNHTHDIVITDILMPKMNGDIMAKKITELNPDAFIVFVTASRDHEEYDGVAKSFKVTKPLSFEVVQEMIEKIAQMIE